MNLPDAVIVPAVAIGMPLTTGRTVVIPTESVPERSLDAVLAPGGPSPAGIAVTVLLVLLGTVGLARSLRRRLDPVWRAERVVFDRAGLSAAERRGLRQAARRLDPSVPAVSLLLAPALLRRARDLTPADGSGRGLLDEIARRRFGSRGMPPAVDEPERAIAVAAPRLRSLVEPPPPLPPTVEPRVSVPDLDDPDHRRQRLASMLAVAMDSAASRRESSSPTTASTAT